MNLSLRINARYTAYNKIEFKMPSRVESKLVNLFNMIRNMIKYYKWADNLSFEQSSLEKESTMGVSLANTPEDDLDLLESSLRKI